MKELTIWITYHDNAQINQYGLYEDETYSLFKGNDLDVKGENINHLNPYYAEIVTLYWVWKNNLKSKKVGFCHYRRKFSHILSIEPGQCQVLAINRNCSVFNHYKNSHNYHDLYDAIDILNNIYGDDNKYAKYLLESKTFIPFCCFIMQWDDFNRLCNFLFPILFAYDNLHGLNLSPQHYAEKAEKDFRYDNITYQQRFMGFMAERLISCYLACEFQINCLTSIPHIK